MLISSLECDKYLIIKLHIEETYNSFAETNDNYLGIYVNNLRDSTIDLINEFLLKHNAEKQYNNVVLDFSSITDVQNNIADKLISLYVQLLASNVQIIMTNISSEIFNEYKLNTNKIYREISKQGYSHNDFYKRTHDSGSFNIFLYKKREEQANDKNLLEIDFNKMYDEQFKVKFISMLKEITEDNHEDRLSSPVILNKYINVKKLIEDSNFLLLCLYFFAIELINKGVFDKDKDLNKEIVLFSHTFSGNFISTILSRVLCVDRFFIDHLGPINKIERINFSNKIDKGKKYIIVSDVICLGTEVKIAKNIIEFCGGNVQACISLISIETTKSETDIKEYFFEKISEKNNPIDYRVRTLLS